MVSLSHIENSIQTLPEKEFLELVDWMTDRHLNLLSSGGFESPELEAELLKSVQSPRYPVDEKLLDHVRRGSLA